LTPTLLDWENLHAGGVFKNGARQPFLLSERQHPGQKLFSITRIIDFYLRHTTFSKKQIPL